jgi:hypothetical protein
VVRKRLSVQINVAQKQSAVLSKILAAKRLILAARKQSALKQILAALRLSAQLQLLSNVGI